MPSELVKAPLLWQDFESLLERVTAASQRGEAELYRFLIFAGLSGYCGLKSIDILSLRWGDVSHEGRVVLPIWLAYRKQPKDKPDCFIYGRQIPVKAELERLIIMAYQLAKPDNSYSCYIVPNLRSCGTEPMTSQYLNRWLKKIAERFELPFGTISTNTFRKTYALHEYERRGRNLQTLIELSQELQHSSAAFTGRFIGLSS